MSDKKPKKLTMESPEFKFVPKPPPRKIITSEIGYAYDRELDEEYYFGLTEEDVVGFTPGDQ